MNEVKFTFDVDDWNSKQLVINGKQYDVNVYADNDELVRFIIQECEQDTEGRWTNNDVTIYAESFDIGVTINSAVNK